MSTPNQTPKDVGIQPSLPRGERPYILPYNRRLHHLHGISLRNLSLEPIQTRARGHTIDDEAVLNTMQSPSKALALRESRELTHTRSSGDLRVHGQSSGTLKPARPRKARRRSTLDWSNSTAGERQERFESAVAHHCLDVFFSVHVEGLEEPVYVSEVRYNTMNPDFKFFDLSGLASSISRRQTILIKIWTREASGEDKAWHFHLLQYTNLRALQFIGKSLDQFSQPLLDNALILHLSDGIYTSFMEYPGDETKPIFAQSDTDASHREPTSSYDALMRLSTLDDSIQDALSTRRKLATQINAMIEKEQTRIFGSDELAKAQSNHGFVLSALESEQKGRDEARKRLEAAKTRMRARKEAMQKGQTSQVEASQHLDQGGQALQQSRATLSRTREEIAGQRRRICEEIQDIYPIDPISGKSLAFTIRGLYLPNSAFNGSDVKEDVVSAALGHVSHLVYLLSFYLSVPLPYPIKPQSSTSEITDPISLMAGSRVFSLHLSGKGNVFYRFEYAVFLLNKNVEVLATRLGIKLPDIRQTLPNIKYVLYVATAGKGDLPMRKAGGIRGLLRGALGSGYASPARRGSDESTVSFRRPA